MNWRKIEHLRVKLMASAILLIVGLLMSGSVHMRSSMLNREQEQVSAWNDCSYAARVVLGDFSLRAAERHPYRVLRMAAAELRPLGSLSGQIR